MAQLIFKVWQWNFESVFSSINVCQNILKDEISIQNILPTISFKTFSGLFLRRGTEILKDLNAI